MVKNVINYFKSNLLRISSSMPTPKVIKGNFGKFILSKLPVSLLYFGLPRMVNIEPINICNLKCALCPYPEMDRKKVVMDFEKYKILIDELKLFKPKIYFTAWGDALLHPKFIEMIKYSSANGIRAGFSSNFCMPLTDKKIKGLVLSGINYIIIDMDGATKETYLKYRKNGDFDRLIKNVKKLVYYKKKYNPHLTLKAQCLIMKQNEHELKEIETLSRNLGFDTLHYYPIFLKQNWSKCSFDTEKREKEGKEFLPENQEYSRYNEKFILKEAQAVCPYIKQAAISSSGNMVICCNDVNSSVIVGNVFEEGFMRIWKSRLYKQIRKDIIIKKFPICKNCDISMFKLKKEILFNKK